ncbi:MAG: hypothetical protein OS112_04165 [Methanoregula sp.]|nr:MAG: hypothetical protein OS112_04165 [Methanoregula sp.]
MTEPWCKGISPRNEEKIKRALESTCELCRDYIPLSLLELHGFPSKMKGNDPPPKERERHILVVCSPCHLLIHEIPVPVEKLRALISRRPFSVRKEILRALGYIPGPYFPPEDPDIPQSFEDGLNSSSAGYYR